MRAFIHLILLSLFLLWNRISYSQQGNDFDIPDAPATLADNAYFKNEKQKLSEFLESLQELTRNFNAACTQKRIPEDDKVLISKCQSMSDEIDKKESWLKTAIKKYIKELQESVEDDKHFKQLVAQATSLAISEGWDKESILRLQKAYNNLIHYYDSSRTEGKVDSVWEIIENRMSDMEIQKVANAAGKGLPGAGKQSYNDCAIFALANASGRPYGVVSTLAMDLIAEAPWRTESDRKDPIKVFKPGGGLSGGELLFLTEKIGKVEVVGVDGFRSELQKGNSIMVSITPGSGDHEVVLSKTFLYKGQSWYEMVDSNMDGPWQRRYLSEKELKLILNENGIVYRSEKGTMVKDLK